jgi:glutathione synthase/RimK-type ligase-like ATP-grasp enzyme
MTVWPDPRDLMMAGSKLYFQAIITRCATSMGHMYLHSPRVEPTAKLIQRITEGTLDAVLKREFSSHGQHVFSADTKNALSKFEGVQDMEEVAYGWGKKDFNRPMWFLQPFIAGLKYLGEIRVFVVNGTIFKSIVTTPGEPGQPLEITEPTMFTPLSKLRYVLSPKIINFF